MLAPASSLVSASARVTPLSFPIRYSWQQGIFPRRSSVSLVRDPRGPARLLRIREEYLDNVVVPSRQCHLMSVVVVIDGGGWHANM